MTLYQCPICRTVRFLSEEEEAKAIQQRGTAPQFYEQKSSDDCPACSRQMDRVEGQSS